LIKEDQIIQKHQRNQEEEEQQQLEENTSQNTCGKFTNAIRKTNQKHHRYIHKENNQRFEQQDIQTLYLYKTL